MVYKMHSENVDIILMLRLLTQSKYSQNVKARLVSLAALNVTYYTPLFFVSLWNGEFQYDALALAGISNCTCILSVCDISYHLA